VELDTISQHLLPASCNENDPNYKNYIGSGNIDDWIDQSHVTFEMIKAEF